MTRLLITFCNLETPAGLPLLVLDLDSGEAHPPATGLTCAVRTCTGMFADASHVYVTYWAEGYFTVSALRLPDLTVVHSRQLPHVRAAHSIVVRDGTLYVVSTGRDVVLAYDYWGPPRTEPEVVWQASDHQDDRHHLNSLTELHGDLIVSGFGERSGELWYSATDGFIHNITRDVRLKDGLWHPHTVTVHDDRLFYCESQRWLFCSPDGPVAKLGGYTRGVAWLDADTALVGTSVWRSESLSTGRPLGPEVPQGAVGTSRLDLVNVLTGGTMRSYETGWFGTEVYDLLVLPS